MQFGGSHAMRATPQTTRVHPPASWSIDESSALRFRRGEATRFHSTHPEDKEGKRRPEASEDPMHDG